jgi:GT2 family glycosyltransferase
MNSPGRIAVLILTVDQREKTLQCLSSLARIRQPAFDVIVWDNGSRDGTREAVRAAYPDVQVHHSETNLGVAGGRNAAAALAIQQLRPEYLLFLDNDMLLEPAFVEALARPFQQDPELGQTQAKLRFMHDRERLNDGGGCRITFWLWRTMPVGYGEIDRGQYDEERSCVACGGAMMVKTDVFQELGGFDTVYGLTGPEDLDFSLRLQKAGYRALYVPSAVAYHEANHTFGKNYEEKYAQLKARNWLIFMRRHASLGQQAAFYVAGAPYLALSVLIREIRRGNFGALRGLFRGALDSWKS